MRRGERADLQDRLAVVRIGDQPLLHRAAQLRPERRVLLRLGLEHGLDGRQHLADQALADELDLAVLLEDLAGDVERQVGGVDDAPHEPQVLRDERLAVVHDEHAPDVELHAAAGLPPEQVHRRVLGQEQQRLVLERALGREPDRRERRLPVVADVPVELGVLLLRHVLLRPGPQRLARVDGLGVVAGAHADRPGDEVRPARHDAAHHARVRVVVQRVVRVDGLEMQRHRRALRQVGRVADRVGALPGRLPPHAGRGPGAAGDQLDAVGDHERGVEADAELADQLGGLLGRRAGVPRLPHGGEHLGGAGLRDRPDQLDDLVTAHPDAVVADGQGAGLGVGLDLDVQVGRVDVEILVLVGRQAQLVKRVRRVGDQLAQEDVLRRVDRMDHQLQQLPGLGLELDRLARVGRHEPPP